ncbi:hypothetical protein Q4503_08360 [Colwellia sp. 6_MG-2023]|uniref:hypothetical protein n=1 Tax=Colwellia sp. 6_MG-2023 TaxID=3062676 RepID=UPI0026E32A21|nr:hypothetical protein [Colwellia sp. 6_MG-2023]MDO6487709.1 hypothetical protein [Colwellia sp. 6_MG-2023]
MCGILGKINFNGTIDKDRFKAMRDTMPYRGPDSNGLWFDEAEKALILKVILLLNLSKEK